MENKAAQRPVLLADMGKFKEILRIYPIVWPRVYLTSAYRKESEFPIEEPIAFIGHDGFCEGL